MFRGRLTGLLLGALCWTSSAGAQERRLPVIEITFERALSLARAQAPTHARAGVQPGSHEDWCGEHQVPESLCTRCNPALVAAFKATGDWCEEHGLPESQCLICNPDLKNERPPRKGRATP